MRLCGCDAAPQVMDATLTEESGYDGEESPGGDLEISDFRFVCFFAMYDHDVTVPGWGGWECVPVMFVVVRGDELAKCGEGLESAAWFATSLEDEGWDGDVDAVDDVGGVVCREGSRVDDDGTLWCGETVGEDVG